MVYIGEIIKEEVERQGRSVKWLAVSLNCSRYNIYDIFKRTTVDTELLFKISQLLGRDFFQLYTEKLNKEKSV